MIIEAMKLAAEFNRYFTSANGVDVPERVSVSRDEWRQLFAALSQQPATTEPVYWEWRHLSTHPDTVDFGKWSEWKRVEARSPIFTADDELRTLRRYIADGYKYELRALYDHPAPSVPADVVRVPLQVMKDASEALGNFVSDHGWGDADMQAMDNLDAYIARHDAKAQKGQP